MYDTLADVYDWLVPASLLEPEGSAAALGTVVGELPAGARVLDCACGTGTLAVGLALRGCEVSASDASAEMVARTRALAAEHGVAVRSDVRRWDELRGGPYDAVFCVGNSLTHAPGRAGRRAALSAMRGVLEENGVLAVTSRNWERSQKDGQEVVERGGRRALVRRAWLAGEPPALEVAVTFEDDGRTFTERLEYWPFTHEELRDDLLAAGLDPLASTFDPDVGRYLVTARAARSAGDRASTPRGRGPRDRAGP